MSIDSSVQKDIFKIILEYTSPVYPHKFNVLNHDDKLREPLAFIENKFYYAIGKKIYVDYMLPQATDAAYAVTVNQYNELTTYYPQLDYQIVWNNLITFNSYLYDRFGSICILITQYPILFEVLNRQGCYIEYCANRGLCLIAKTRFHHSKMWYLDFTDGYFYWEGDNRSKRYTADNIIKYYDNQKYDYTILTT